MKKEKSCGAVIYNYFNGELCILLLRHNSGHWSFSKGHMKDCEKEEETAIREIKEETNLDVVLDNNFRFVNTYEPKEDVIKDVVYFVGYPVNYDVKIQTSEISDYKWLNSDKAYDLLTYDSDKEVLRKACEFITYEEENNKSIK